MRLATRVTVALALTLSACTSELSPIDYCVRTEQILCSGYACCTMPDLRRPCDYDPASDASRRTCMQTYAGIDGVSVRWDAAAAEHVLSILEQAAASCVEPDLHDVPSPIVPQIPNGGACDPHSPSAWFACIDGFCDPATQRCTAVAFLGEPCGACAPPLYCDTTTMRCATPLDDGSACSASAGARPCLSGTCQATGTCATRAPDGAPCFFDMMPPCAGECVASVCRTQSAADHLYCRQY